MPIRNDIRTEALLAQFRAQRTTSRRGSKESESSRVAASQAVRVDVRLQAQVSAQPAAKASEDRVEISLAANLTVEAVNGILNDSVVEQINKAIQEAGINLRVEDSREAEVDTSPEATARRVVDFAAGFLDAFRQNVTSESGEAQILGFMSLIRGAIQEGFQQGRDFLQGITTLSETIDENIDRTFEVANRYLDDFHQAQRNLIRESERDRTAEPVGAPDASTKAVE